MFCSGCGQALAAGEAFCSRCGRPLAAAVPPVPGLQFQLANYAGKVRLLSIFWFVYAGLTIFFGLIGMAFAKAFLGGHFQHFGPWMNGNMPPMWFFPAAIHFLWLAILLKTCLAIAAGWGLMEHRQWGRIVAIVAAILSLLKFPLGTALGIWTLVMLLGYRNSSLYDQL